MLINLSIKNLALIDSLEIKFHSGFSVITGETGAGKSVIIGALSMLTGTRTDSNKLKDRTKKAVVGRKF